VSHVVLRRLTKTWAGMTVQGVETGGRFMKRFLFGLFLVSMAACSKPPEPLAPTPAPSPADAVATPTPQDLWKEKGNWRKLNKGMNKEEVTQLLGEPGSIKVSSYEKWFYPAGAYIEFDNNKVVGWSEPLSFIP